ncbi:MAG: Rieske (2Fe-2S) protein [Candidatus Izemoplasmataceae bacterium]|jgi:3-phenylpropionate/trans-cinnamate dioxygenase ferredoxin component
MEFKEVASLKALEKEFKIRIVLDNNPILLTYFNSKVYAISDKCPHMGASLEKGHLEDGIVTCAKHGAQINVTNGNIEEKAKVLFLKLPTKNAKTYEVKVEEDKVYVKL